MIIRRAQKNDIDGLNFEIDHTSKMATDNLHRNYHPA